MKIIIEPSPHAEKYEFIARSTDPGLLHEIFLRYRFPVPGAAHMRRVNARLRNWDGHVALLQENYKKTALVGPSGLARAVATTAAQCGAAVELDESYAVSDIPRTEYIEKFYDAWIRPLSKKELRDYQSASVAAALRQRCAIIVSPTASGKSLIIYTYLRYLRHAGKSTQAALIIVPTISLVEQMRHDFLEYGHDEARDGEIVTSTERFKSDADDESKKVYISTWQTLSRLPAAWFRNRFDVVIGDEAHTCQAKTLKNLLSKNLGYVPWRLGTTGTLHDEQLQYLTVIGQFGSAIRFIDTSKMIERAYAPPLRVTLFKLKHRVTSLLRDYYDEIEYLINSKNRTRIIVKLVGTCAGNTVVFFRYVRHGQLLRDALAREYPNRPIFYVDGSTRVEEREQIRAEIESCDDAILVASLGTFSTGVNIPKLHNMVLATPTKSKIRVLQTIGRMLRLHPSKKRVEAYDFVDTFTSSAGGHIKNYQAQAGNTRQKYYDLENFKVRHVEIDVVEDKRDE